jgi:hypothetical protein
MSCVFYYSIYVSIRENIEIKGQKGLEKSTTRERNTENVFHIAFFFSCSFDVPSISLTETRIEILPGTLFLNYSYRFLANANPKE